MKKYLVICISSETGVCSVDPFNTEKEAQEFLKKDAQNTFEDEQENNKENDTELYSEDNYAQLTDEEYSWNWTIHEINFN